MSSYPQFLLVGDSLLEFSTHLTSGFSFTAALQSRYIRRLDVINRGFSGYNTSHILEILSRIIPDPAFAEVKYILILLGSNDACLPLSPTKQHVPLHQFAKNLQAIIHHSSITAHNPRIILVTPPPVEETLCEAIDASKGLPLCRHAAVTAKYAQAVRDMGKTAGDNVTVVDLWTTIMDEAVSQRCTDASSNELPGVRALGVNECLAGLMHDGLHLSAKGYQIFWDELMNTLERKWPNDTPEKQDYVFPNWREAPKFS